MNISSLRIRFLVVQIMSVAEACERDELIKIKTDNIEFKEHLLIVHIPESKMKQSRILVIIIDKTDNAVNYVKYCQNYIDLSQQCQNNRSDHHFFFSFFKVRYTNQLVRY